MKRLPLSSAVMDISLLDFHMWLKIFCTYLFCHHRLWKQHFVKIHVPWGVFSSLIINSPFPKNLAQNMSSFQCWSLFWETKIPHFISVSIKGLQIDKGGSQLLMTEINTVKVFSLPSKFMTERQAVLNSVIKTSMGI